MEVKSTSCIIDQELRAYREGYNAIIKAYIDCIHGQGTFDSAREEIEQFRLKSYNAYFEYKNVEDNFS